MMELASNSVGLRADPVKIVLVPGEPAGYPTSHPAEAPKETTPICFHFCQAAPSLTSNFMFNGPPESPLHVPFPPVVSMHTTPSWTIPYTALHSALVMMGRSSTILKTGEIPPALSEGFPHPVAVTSSSGSAVSPISGRQLGLM